MTEPQKRIAPPGGVTQPPTRATDGTPLAPLAEEIADRYFAEFPDDFDRYGPVAREWAVHDTKWLLSWADWESVDLDAEVNWLANVLDARDFPIERLARNLQLCADVAETGLPEAAPPLRAAATKLYRRA